MKQIGQIDSERNFKTEAGKGLNEIRPVWRLVLWLG